MTRDLGREWDIITDMAIKLVPGGHPSHALAEAAANAARAGNVSPDEVETITLSRPGVTALSGPVHPTDLIGMAHSPAYFLAAGVADHDFSWVHATEAKITDPVIQQLLDKVPSVLRPPKTSSNTSRARRHHSDKGRQDLLEYCLRAQRGRRPRHRLGRRRCQIRTLVPRAQLSDRQVESSLQVIHDFRNVTHVSVLTELLHALE